MYIYFQINNPMLVSFYICGYIYIYIYIYEIKILGIVKIKSTQRCTIDKFVDGEKVLRLFFSLFLEKKMYSS